ncbi:MAG: transposase [Myxococcales bacterium]|nr:transposase [Myxococcales bacterium]
MRPRRVLPGRKYLITRAVVRRMFLFRPDKDLNQLFTYCLAVVAAKHNITTHAACLMSNHLHLVVTDNCGVLPLFLRDLHRSIANATKVLRGMDGSVFDSREPNVTELVTPAAVIEKVAYVLNNPVEAGAVKFNKDWPGVLLRPGTRVRGRRPDFYFGKHGIDWPESMDLVVDWPAFDDTTPAETQRWLEEEERLGHRAAVQRVADNGWRFLGPKRVLRRSPFDRATGYREFGQRNPTFAVGRRNRQAFLDAVASLREFRRRYRQALTRWKAGISGVPFPSGTWWMRIFHGAVTEAVLG